MFFDTNRRELKWDEFLDYYEPYYFINDKPKLFKCKMRDLNQTSKFVEDNIENILKNGLDLEDIILVIAWKLGMIDHYKSEECNWIIYRNNFSKYMIYKRYSEVRLSPMISYIKDNFKELSDLAGSEPYSLFKKICENKVKGFGSTYIINLVFFFTGGRMPIYDKFVKMALWAFENNLVPDTGEVIKVKEIPGLNYLPEDIDKAWNYYQDYIVDLKRVSNSDFITRKVDRALWVYGHGFETDIKKKS